jgi:glucosylceramidase
LYYTNTSTGNIISVDGTQTFQTIDGFGYTLTGGSAMHLYAMDADKRAALLKELFAWDGFNIGTSYLRISIGSSDLDDHVFSYDDLPAGDSDINLAKFDLGPDKNYLIPVLKQILAINPDIKILGSPWSPPAWMKTNGATSAGSLIPKYYNTYAGYFIKYIQAMQAQGITIDAITVQNEPLNPNNNPSMVMQPDEQAAFIKQSLGPAFKTAGMATKIILYDHNCDRPDYPETILSDPDAAKYVDGSAFHLYAGNISVLAQVHSLYPAKNLYFTEQWVGAPGNLKGDLDWHIQNVIIGSMLNWSRNALEWNLAANTALEPHTPGGCTQCLGAVTIDGNNVTRNPAYYTIAHAAKFVRPGSVRIASTMVGGLPNVAFKTPDGKMILIVENTGTATATFAIQYSGKAVAATLNAGAVGTFVW